MKIIFESGDRRFEVEADNVEDIFWGVRDGMVAMGYHINTANELKQELADPENN